MNYNMDSHIKSVEDVKTFFHHLVSEHRLNFHPDDDFADYINYEDKTSSFTEYEVTLYNRLMEESFIVCEKVGIDIYAVGLDELQEAMGFKTEE